MPELLADPTKRRQEKVCTIIPAIETLSYSLITLPSNNSSWGMGWNESIFFTFKHQPDIAFGANQPTLLALANEMFGGSTRLNDFEERVLEKTFLRTLKRTPTRPNRL